MTNVFPSVRHLMVLQKYMHADSAIRQYCWAERLYKYLDFEASSTEIGGLGALFNHISNILKNVKWLITTYSDKIWTESAIP